MRRILEEIKGKYGMKCGHKECSAVQCSAVQRSAVQCSAA